MSSSEASRGVPVSFADAAHERLAAALKVSRAGTWRWRIADDVVEWDGALCTVYGIEPAEAPRNSGQFLSLVHPDDRQTVLETINQCIETRGEADFQFRVLVGEQMRWIYDCSGVVCDEDGNPAYMLGACLDVTARRRSEEERQRLQQKHTLLLREIVHRTKNHLSMVISMLRLKAGKQTDASVKQDFEQVIERIHTIAYLHEQLYQSDTFHRIQVHSYLEQICAYLEQSIFAESKVSLVRELAPAVLHIDQAVPLGLIVNEAVTNAAKYAFDPGQPGKIVVRFHRQDDRGVLTISDNGRGLSPGKALQGVGTTLIKSLAKQIGAKLRVVSRKGLTYSLAFRTLD